MRVFTTRMSSSIPSLFFPSPLLNIPTANASFGTWLSAMHPAHAPCHGPLMAYFADSHFSGDLPAPLSSLRLHPHAPFLIPPLWCAVPLILSPHRFCQKHYGLTPATPPYVTVGGGGVGAFPYNFMFSFSSLLQDIY